MTQNREQWLTKGADALNSKILAPQNQTAEKIKVSVGFPKGSRGKGNSAIGQCWSPTASDGKISEIFISPTLTDPPKILATLLHELIHAAVGNEVGHRGPFKHLAQSVGLEGKMTATIAGPELSTKLCQIAKRIGTYPHDALNPSIGHKKQTTRLVKICCPMCENVARQARGTFEQFGLICGRCEEPMVENV